MRFINIHLYLAIFLTLTSARAEAQARTKEDAKRLVVMISGTLGKNTTSGGGIIIGRDGSTLYILTANHVLRSGDKVIRNSKALLWIGTPAKPQELPLTLLDYDSDLDIAAVQVQLPATLDQFPDTIRSNCLVGSNSVFEDMPVILMGHGSKSAWHYSTVGNKISEPPQENRFNFESINLADGDSGGGLFTDNWELIGMIQGESNTDAYALPIEAALKWAESKKYPIMLKPHLAIYSFTASPTSTAYNGATQLKWSTSYGCKARIAPAVGEVGSKGSEELILEDTTEFVLTCAQGTDSVTRSVQVVVLMPPSTRSFELRTPAAFPGADATLAWDVLDATSCTIDQGIGDVPTTGSVNIKVPLKPTTFTLSCDGEGGTSQRSLEVAPQLRPTITTFKANPDKVDTGGEVILGWTSENADTCALDGAAVAKTGDVAFRLSANRTFTLICKNGSGSDSKTLTVPVRPSVVIHSFSATPTEINAGDTSTLQWSVSNATSCSLSGQAVQDYQGEQSLDVAPPRTTSYTLRCTGPGGPATRSATVSVNEKVTVTSFSASPASITQGDQSKLSWSSTGAQSCSISPGFMDVAASGSEYVTPNETTTYDIECTGRGGTDSKKTKVRVKSGPLFCCNAVGAKVCPMLVPGVPGAFCQCMNGWGVVYFSGASCY
ncbi:serine protease [Archangium gephyra]|uniref:S1 family peptidase n=1 Tax=Archangium gephyra TaxID=48 RepID=UPI0035D443E4